MSNADGDWLTAHLCAQQPAGPVAQLLAAIAALTAPCDEHADPCHVTASAIVVGPSGVLLHRHKRLGRWLQPGGHIDPGERPPAAALRETAEETGLDARFPGDEPVLLQVDIHPAPKGHTHLDLRYLLTADGEPDPPAQESQHVRWFAFSDAVALTSEGGDEPLAQAIGLAERWWRAAGGS